MRNMYRYQGTANRSNGIYCEPDAVAAQPHHHFSPPPTHMSKKMTKMRSHRSSRNNRSAHLPQHRSNDESEVDSSSEVSDGTYPDSDSHPGISLTNRLNITQNGKHFYVFFLTFPSQSFIPSVFSIFDDALLGLDPTQDRFKAECSTLDGFKNIVFSTMLTRFEFHS